MADSPLRELLQETVSAWLFWAVPAWFVLCGTLALVKLAHFYRRATGRANGVVVALEPFQDGEGATLYRPLVEFEAEGQTHRVADPMASRPALRVGQAVVVYLVPGKPHEAQFGRARYVGPFLLLLVVGGTWLAAGVWLWLALGR